MNLQTLELLSASSSRSSTVRLFQSCGPTNRAHYIGHITEYTLREDVKHISTETPGMCVSTLFVSS